MCPDWDDTVKSREAGELVGFVGANETVEANGATPTSAGEPIEDVRRDAVEDTEAAGVEVVESPQPPARNDNPAPTPSSEPGVGGPESSSESSSSNSSDVSSSSSSPSNGYPQS